MLDVSQRLDLTPQLPETCCWVSSHTNPQSTGASVSYRTCVRYHMCLIIWHVCSIPSWLDAFSSAQSSAFLLHRLHCSFLPFASLHLLHVPPPLPPVLFSLGSNHTRLVRLSSAARHMETIGGSPPPLFFCPLLCLALRLCHAVWFFTVLNHISLLFFTSFFFF